MTDYEYIGITDDGYAVVRIPHDGITLALTPDYLLKQVAQGEVHLVQSTSDAQHLLEALSGEGESL